MSATISRRDLLQIAGGAAATFGLLTVAAELAPVRAFGQSAPVRSVKDDYKEDFFYREDWLGEPWRNPDTVALIHGNDGPPVRFCTCFTACHLVSARSKPRTNIDRFCDLCYFARPV
jgi:hypothetical protein